MTTSTSIVNVCVLGGRAIEEPISKRVQKRSDGQSTTVTTFVLKTYAGPREPSLRIQVEAWSHVATVAQHITKGRRVIVTGALTQQSWQDKDQKTQYRMVLRATQVSLLDTPDQLDTDQE